MTEHKCSSAAWWYNKNLLCVYASKNRYMRIHRYIYMDNSVQQSGHHREMYWYLVKPTCVLVFKCSNTNHLNTGELSTNSTNVNVLSYPSVKLASDTSF